MRGNDNRNITGLVLIALAVFLASCGGKSDFQHNAYVLADSCTVRQERHAGSVKAGKLAFLEPVRIEETDVSAGTARIVSAKGVKGWISIMEASGVPPRWRDTAIDDFIVISLPGDIQFTHVKNDAGDGEGELTEFKFFNADYFINLVRTSEPWEELVARGRETASRRGDAGVTPGEITLGGLTGYFYPGSSDHDGMPALTWIIRGHDGISYIFHVTLQREGRGEHYGLTARHIIFSARRK